MTASGALGALVLGIDLGTTGTRCVVHDHGLRAVSSAYVECAPDHGADGSVEQTPGEWLEALAVSVRRALDGFDPARVVSLAISAQGITIVPVDRKGAPVRPALSWLDARGASMLAYMDERTPKREWCRRTWKPWDGAYSLPKILWMREHEPDLWDRVTVFLTPHDHLVEWLCGERLTEPTLAAGSMAFDVRRRVWDEELLATVELDPSLLPPVVSAGTRAGSLLPGPAALLGLPEGMAVVVGGQDQKLAALAAGLAPGVHTLSLGTAAALEVWVDDASVDPPDGMAGFPAPVGEGWLFEAVLPTAGAAYRWLLATIAPGQPYADLDEEARATYPDVQLPLFFPYLNTATADGDASGGVFWGLGPNTSRGDLVRAVMESVAFEVAPHARSMEPIPHLRMFGGGARSPFWCQVISDAVAGTVTTWDNHEAAAAGAAVLAGMGVGLWTRAEAGELLSRRTGPSYHSDADAAAQLAKRFERWSRIRARILRTSLERTHD